MASGFVIPSPPDPASSSSHSALIPLRPHPTPPSFLSALIPLRPHSSPLLFIPHIIAPTSRQLYAPRYPHLSPSPDRHEVKCKAVIQRNMWNIGWSFLLTFPCTYV